MANLRQSQDYAMKFANNWERAKDMSEFLSLMGANADPENGDSAYASACAAFMRKNGVPLRNMPPGRKASDTNLNFAAIADAAKKATAAPVTPLPVKQAAPPVAASGNDKQHANKAHK